MIRQRNACSRHGQRLRRGPPVQPGLLQRRHSLIQALHEAVGLGEVLEAGCGIKDAPNSVNQQMQDNGHVFDGRVTVHQRHGGNNGVHGAALADQCGIHEIIHKLGGVQDRGPDGKSGQSHAGPVALFGGPLPKHDFLGEIASSLYLLAKLSFRFCGGLSHQCNLRSYHHRHPIRNSHKPEDPEQRPHSQQPGEGDKVGDYQQHTAG
mmetsp:Transcript_59293/g.129860  ORF Transcript_59293/g.129860 Transcript_59293/m.129860 type:complete len:207 (+) Transcript_59293:724-1344(+)